MPKGLPVKAVVTGSDGYSSTSTSYTYTSDNNYLKSVTDATGATAEYTYNSRGLVSKITEPNGNVTEYEYDPDTDELISVSNPSEALGNPSTEFEYDSAGRIFTIDSAELITFYYDEFGRLLSSDMLGILQTINSYNDDDNIEWQYYANDSSAEFFYDEDGRLTEELYNDTLTYEYFYSNDGKLSKVADYESGEEWNYQYDMMERLTSVSSDDGRSLFYNYNTKNQLGSFKVLDSNSVIHETAYTYDNSGRVTGTQIPSMQGNPIQQYTYDSLGRSSRFKNYYNGNNYIEAVYSYRRVNEAETGQVQRVGYFRNGSLYGLDRRYEYDVNGNITHIYEGSGLIVRYKYDGMSRLIREDNYNAHKTVVYAYDSNGNMTSKTEYALSFTDELGTPVDTVTSTFNNGVWQSAITSYDGDWVFRYDMGGNPVSYRGYAMTWAKGRQLSALSGNGITASFKYNNNGIRTSKTVNGVETEYFYVGDTLISQKTGNEVINFAYTAGGAPLGFTYNGTPYYYMLNLQGDIEKIYDATGEVVVTYIYDAWGKLISIEDDTTNNIGTKNPLRYRGYYYDTETGFYYLQSRYYDPEICRFINADSLIIAGNDYIQGANRYAYCYNNPVMYVDPSGYVVNGELNSSEQVAVDVTLGIIGLYIFTELVKEFDVMGLVNAVLYKDGTPIVVDFEFDVHTFEMTGFLAGIIEDVGGFVTEKSSTIILAILGTIIGGPITGVAFSGLKHVGVKALEELSGNVFQLVTPGEYALFNFYFTLDKGNYEYRLIEFSVLKYIGEDNKGFSTFEWFTFNEY